MANKILLVDDELDWVRILTQIIEQAGYEVESANNGREAIGAYIEALYRQKPISLILLDIRLPDINGIEVLDIIRKEEQQRGIAQDSGVSVIMLTAHDRPWMDPSLIKGSSDYMLKSDNSEEILKKIKEKIGG